MHKLVRITTIPLSLEKLLEGQLTYMNILRSLRFLQNKNVWTVWKGQ